MRRLPHPTWLRAFEAAARHSSFTAAAEELNLTPAAVSQQIRLLEKSLDIQLFKRLAKGVELTDIGQAYAQPIRKGFADMQLATDGLFQVKRKSTIRVRASISFAALVLAPRLNDFRALHPEIEIDLSTAVWPDRITDASIDLDIRYGDGDWPEHEIFRLNMGKVTLVCHPAYLASLGEEPSVAGFAAGNVVQIVGSEGDWVNMFRVSGLEPEPPKHWMKADSSLIALQVVASGFGVAIISRSFARNYLEAGTLVTPCPLDLPMQHDFYIVQRDDLKKRPDVAAFVDWMVAQEF